LCICSILKTSQITRHRAGFIPRNNLDSTRTPIFRPQTLPSTDDQEDSHLSTSFYSTSDLSLHLSHRRRRSESLASTHAVGGKTLSELGDSSSLFSFQSPSNCRSASASSPYIRDQSPIPFELDPYNNPEQFTNRTRQESKMVNERSPAKAPLRPVVPNDQPPPSQEAESSALSKPAQLTSAQFGQHSKPQSTLNRPAHKESNVFMQPKSRPEHHRDTNKPGTTLFNV
jgi:hypothetical protein